MLAFQFALRSGSTHCIYKEAGLGFSSAPGFSPSVKAARAREDPSHSQQGTWQRGRCQNHRFQHKRLAPRSECILP